MCGCLGVCACVRALATEASVKNFKFCVLITSSKMLINKLNDLLTEKILTSSQH